MGRQELNGLFVGFGKINRKMTRAELLPGLQNTFRVAIRPVDQSGNLLGPGSASQVRIEIDGLKPVTTVIDRLDGSYLRVYSGRETDAKSV